MEDVKWLLRKGGPFFVGLLIVIITVGLIFGRMDMKQDKVSEEVWEPPVEISSNEIEVIGTEESTDSSLWFLPQASDCLISEEEKQQIKDMALRATEQAKIVYKDIEIEDGPTYSSNITNFSEEQVKEVVRLLGESGVVSVAENVNMENPEAIKEFYSSYLNKKDAMFTVFEVNSDGLIGVITFVYRQDKLQTYYVGVGWKEGGIPELRDTLVSNVAEIKLTEKGYFIYAYETVIAHASLRQYWRTAPLSDECRELTEKYISGLSYVNYNMLVTNWDSSNVEDILMPCMFEDIYRIHTGENLRVSGNDGISAEIYEEIMTTYFPVSIEQLRENCGYDESSNRYQYEMIFASPYPPFGEVVDYNENADGTITLFVDGVWADYNSDYAFTNQIVILPLENGRFRYLSNSITQKELDLPPIARMKG